MKNETSTIDKLPRLINDINIVCNMFLNALIFFTALSGRKRRNVLNDVNCPKFRPF